MKQVDCSTLMDLCSQYYPKKKFFHASRVAAYAMVMAQKSKSIRAVDAWAVGMAHDLIEDTECPQEKLQECLGLDLFSAVVTLTKDDKMSYEDYIYEVIDSKDDLAILVKRADMKDHLMQTETLTDKLKEKYFPIVGLLL